MTKEQQDRIQAQQATLIAQKKELEHREYLKHVLEAELKR